MEKIIVKGGTVEERGIGIVQKGIGGGALLSRKWDDSTRRVAEADTGKNSEGV